MSTTRRADGFLSMTDAGGLRVLFMAPYAPDAPDYLMNPFARDGGYPEYHFKVFSRLNGLGFRVSSTSKAYAIVHAGGETDFIFSLFNRMPVRNSEVFISSYCEFLALPYLGAPPNVRAVAEDKLITKLMAQAVGIPAPAGKVFPPRASLLEDPPPFPGPYFIKDRFGAASEGISERSLQAEWLDAQNEIVALWEAGQEVLVEEYVDGIDITVPVLGDDVPRVLGIYEPISDKQGHILTHDLKLNDHLGYREVDLGPTRVAIERDVLQLWTLLGPIDYFRMDYRWNPLTGERRFLELNICCYIGEHGPFGIAAQRDGLTIDRLMEHMIAFSLLRQKDRLRPFRRIL